MSWKQKKSKWSLKTKPRRHIDEDIVEDEETEIESDEEEAEE